MTPGGGGITSLRSQRQKQMASLRGAQRRNNLVDIVEIATSPLRGSSRQSFPTACFASLAMARRCRLLQCRLDRRVMVATPADVVSWRQTALGLILVTDGGRRGICSFGGVYETASTGSSPGCWCDRVCGAGMEPQPWRRSWRRRARERWRQLCRGRARERW